MILLQDVPKVGRKFSAVQVAPGYARNFLFPRNLAIQATAEKITALETEREAHAAEYAAQLTELREQLSALADGPVTMQAKADRKGNLFKKLRQADIASVLATAHNISLPEEYIVLDEPIATTGEHTVHIRFEEGEAIDCQVVVEGE